jgi:two-component system cell cycle sensor histidine kinase/response regulator CckA
MARSALGLQPMPRRFAARAEEKRPDNSKPALRHVLRPFALAMGMVALATATRFLLDPRTEVVVFTAIAAVTLVLNEALRRAKHRGDEQAIRLRAELAEYQQFQEALDQAKAELERSQVMLTKTNGRLQEAQARAQRLAALVASSEDAIIGNDLGGVITDWNTGAEHLFGYSAEEAIGKHCSLLFSQESDGEIAQAEARLRRGEEVPPYETVRRTKDGKEIPVSVQVSLIKEGEKVIGLSSINRDLRSTRGLQEQLRQAQKMEAVGQLAGGVAHDFNNLLCVINGYSEKLCGQLASDDPLAMPMQEIRNAGERAATLTRQLLAFSRKQVLEIKVVHLNETVEQAGKMLHRLIGEDVTLSTVLAPNLAQVKVDPGQLEQVLMNLAVNARDAMPQGGKLTIETMNVEIESSATGQGEIGPGRYVMLAVSDTGCGMDRQTQERIFEPFFTTKGVGKGTGLGLAVVHGIVKQSGGRIAVYSEPGHGTTFKIYLPAIAAVRKLGKSYQGCATVPTGSETILLVEDEEAVRKISCMVLRDAGYTVLEAGNGVEALRVAAEAPGRIDLLVSDVVMPKMGGPQLAQRLTAQRRGLKVLYMSGYTDDAVVRHGILHEELAFLQKPFTPGALARKVREVLEQE